MNWLDNKANETSLSQSEYLDRICWKATVASDDDMRGMYGDGDGGQPRKRAQKSGLIKVDPPYSEVYTFSLCFPAEWKLEGVNTTVFSLHHKNALNPSRNAAPLDFIVKDDRIVCILRPTSKGKQFELFSKVIVPDQWDDYVVNVKMHTVNGSILIERNGQVIADYTGQTVDADDKQIYPKVGPYVWGAFPAGINYRRMYFQI